MKNLKHLLLLMFLGSLAPLAVIGQDDPDDPARFVRERDMDQYQQYSDGDYLFPPQPKNNLSVGIKGGLSYVSGDVSPQADFGFDLNVRKALGHVFSLRAYAGAGRTNGLNYQAARGYRGHANPWNKVYNSDGTPDPVFYNFQMRYGHAGIQGIVNLNNINFYKEQSQWNLFIGGGLGAMAYATMVDAGSGDDPNNPTPYNFQAALDEPLNPAGFDVGGKRPRLDILKNSILDGTYESLSEGHLDRASLDIGGNTYIVNPEVTVLGGVRYRVGRRVEIELEHRVSWTNDDLLDGHRWSEHGGDGTVMTRNEDMLHLTSLGVHFRLGKSAESLWWTNPLTEVYSSAQESRNLIKKLTDDSDNDGVPDLYDQEPDTPEETPVDGTGRTLDSDGDGFADNVDDQPFSPKGANVDGSGRAVDSDNDGVPDIYDKEPNSPPGRYYDAKGVAIVMPDVDVPELPCLLPVIHFDLDRDDIKPEFYPELYYIAQVMNNDKNIRVRAVGHTDIRNTETYNLDLSKRRVENAVDFIANTYGIDPGRFVTEFQGEGNTRIQDLPDNHTRKLEPLHYVNRRVEFECIQN